LLYEYNLPDVPINKGLRKKLEPLPTKVLFAYFAKLDTKFVDKLKRSKKPNKLKEFQNNKNRIIRYIEIAEKLGSVPELKKVKRFKKNKYNLHIIKTSVERKDLQERIYKRTQERLEAGMLQELQSIIGKYKLKEKYVRAWGYEFSLMWDLLHKKINHKFFLDTFVLKEYQYARRQDTWFRRYKNHL
jgi:tRNA A37 N6-isopentenylltransferase MiaA